MAPARPCLAPAENSLLIPSQKANFLRLSLNFSISSIDKSIVNAVWQWTRLRLNGGSRNPHRCPNQVTSSERQISMKGKTFLFKELITGRIRSSNWNLAFPLLDFLGANQSLFIYYTQSRCRPPKIEFWTPFSFSLLAAKIKTEYFAYTMQSQVDWSIDLARKLQIWRLESIE